MNNDFFFIIWLKSGKNLTYSSCHWKEWFCRKRWIYRVIVTAAQFLYRLKFFQNLPYLAQLPYMEIAMIHTAYFHFQLISKSFLPCFLIWSVCSSKTYSKKLIVPFIFKKSKKKVEICLVPKIKSGKCTLNLLSTIKKKDLKKEKGLKIWRIRTSRY